MQLTDKDLVIGDDTSKALAALKLEQKKEPLFEMSVFCVAVME